MKQVCAKSMALVLVIATAWPSAGSVEVAAEQPIDSVQLGRLLRDSNADLPIYSCDLRKQFSQCREYSVAPGNADLRVAELADSCSSLGGALLLTACPASQVLARCHEVKFRRDAVYTAVYYKGKPTNWTVKELKAACKNLPGQFALPTK